MGILHADQRHESNPLDRVMRLAENNSWSVERTTDQEVNMVLSGQWCDLYVAINWRDDLESLHIAATFDLRVPESRREELAKLLALVNSRLYHGHFDLWDHDGSVIYRNGLLLTGGTPASDAQCAAMLRMAAETCQLYYPALQYVCWAGRTARDALDCILFETIGEA